MNVGPGSQVGLTQSDNSHRIPSKNLSDFVIALCITLEHRKNPQLRLFASSNPPVQWWIDRFSDVVVHVPGSLARLTSLRYRW